MRTVDPEQHRERRLRIITAAVELFAQRGFSATTTAEISRAAGTSTGNLFHYFPSKRAILHAMFELDRGEWDEAFTAAAAEPDPRRALDGLVDRFAAEAAYPFMQGLIVEVLAQAHRDPEFAELLAASDRRMVHGVAEVVDRLVAAGLADPGAPADVAARWVLTLTDGLYGRGHPEPGRDLAAAAAETRDLVARVLRCRT